MCEREKKTACGWGGDNPVCVRAWSAYEVVCCSMLQCVAVCCSVLQLCCSVLQRVAACCNVLGSCTPQTKMHARTQRACTHTHTLSLSLFLSLSLSHTHTYILTHTHTHTHIQIDRWCGRHNMGTQKLRILTADSSKLNAEHVRFVCVCCRVLQCVAVCCSALQCVAEH